MKCMKFESLLSSYFDEDVDIKIKEEMNVHIKDCPSCQDSLNKRKKLMASFKYVLEDEDIQVISRKKEIIKNINSSRYSKNLRNKVFRHLNRYKPVYISTLAAGFLLLVLLNQGVNISSQKTSYSKANSLENKVEKADKSNSSFDTQIPAIKPTSTVAIKYDALPNDQLNPTGDGISSIVKSECRKGLLNTLKEMRDLPPGVGPWKTIYYNNDKLMFYNNNHLVAYDYNEKEKGIYAILDVSSLNVGSYQGSQVIRFSFSPDGNYCLFGTYTGEIDIKYNKDLYIYNVADGTVKKILTNFCFSEDNVIWYSSQDVSPRWIVSAKDDKTSIMWDVNSSKPLGTLPPNIKEAKVNVKKYLYFDNLNVKDNTGYTFKLDTERSADRWWFKDESTLVGVPFKDTSNMTGKMDLRLLDFEIVEININEKTGKIVFRP